MEKAKPSFILILLFPLFTLTATLYAQNIQKEYSKIIKEQKPATIHLQKSDHSTGITNTYLPVKPPEMQVLKYPYTEVLTSEKKEDHSYFSRWRSSLNKVSSVTVYHEDFEGGMPGNWTLIDNDGLTPASSVSYVTDAWIVRDDYFNSSDSCAFSTSWYSPAGTADDWMITHKLWIGANYNLKWSELAPDNAFPDGYIVYISTTTPDIAGCQANPPLYSTTGAADVWTDISVNLDSLGYANDSVYFAFRNNSNDEYLLMIDDVMLTETVTGVDLVLSTADVERPSEFTIIPDNLVTPIDFNAEIYNIGTTSATNVELNVDIYRDSIFVGTYSSTVQDTLTVGDTLLFSIPSINLTEIGDYTFYAYPAAVETDINPANDTIVYDWYSISDSIYARDADMFTGYTGIGSKTSGELGVVYHFDKASSVDAIITALGAGDSSLSGVSLFGFIRPFNGAPVDSVIIAKTDTITLPPVTNGFVTIPFSTPAVLDSGSYIFSLYEPDSISLNIHSETTTYTPNVSWVITSAQPWYTIEYYGMYKTLFLRLSVIEPDYDLELVLQPEFPTPYSMLPLSQVHELKYSALLENTGNMNLNNVGYDVEVFHNAASVYNSYLTEPGILEPGRDTVLSFTGFTPADTGNYRVVLTAAADESESDLSNNSIEMEFTVTDSVFARDDGTVDGSMGISSSEPGEIGHFFEFSDSARIGSIDLKIDNTTKIMTGYPVFAYVREFNTQPGTVIDSTCTVTVTDTSVHTVRLHFDPVLELGPGKYFFSIIEPDSVSYSIVYSYKLFSNNACWISFPSSPYGLWDSTETFGLNYVYHIRANLTSPPPPLSAGDGSLLPDEYELSQNFPNPFNPITTIKYALPKDGKVTLKIYDILGAEVAVLVNDIKNAGYHKIEFNASKLSSGVYFYRITAGNFTDTKKFVLLK